MRTAWTDEDGGFDRQVARDSGQQRVVRTVMRWTDFPVREGYGLSAAPGDALSYVFHPLHLVYCIIYTYVYSIKLC